MVDITPRAIQHLRVGPPTPHVGQMTNDKFKLMKNGKSISFRYEGLVAHRNVWERCLDVLTKESAYAKSGKSMVKNVDLCVSKAEEIANKDLGLATYHYQQYVMHDGVLFPIAGAVISFHEEEEGLVTGSSDLVPNFAALDFPSRDLFEANDDIEVVKVKGEDPDMFCLSFAVPNYNRELKTAWLDLEGKPLGNVQSDRKDTW